MLKPAATFCSRTNIAMVTPAVAVPVNEIASALLAVSEVASRAQVIAERVCQLVPDSAAVVYVIEDQDNASWKAKAAAGEIQAAEEVELNAGTLGKLASS